MTEALYDWIAFDTANSGGWKWLGLLDENGVEVTGSGYARQELIWEGDISDNVEYDGTQEYLFNNNIFFTGITIGTEVTSWRLYTASTGGTAMVGNDLAYPETMISGGNYVVNEGEMVFALGYSTYYGVGPKQSVAEWMAGVRSLNSVGGQLSVNYHWYLDLGISFYPGPQLRWGATYVSGGYVPTFDSFGGITNGGANLEKGFEVFIDEAALDPDITAISLSRTDGSTTYYFFDSITPFGYDIGDLVVLDVGDLTLTVVGTEELGVTAVLEIGSSSTVSVVTPTVTTSSALVDEIVSVGVASPVPVAEHLVPLYPPGTVRDFPLLIDTNPISLEYVASGSGWNVGFLPI
jgi:hypothetical protein